VKVRAILGSVNCTVRANGLEIYNALLNVGAEFGIRRLGGRAKMVNHVEACFPTPSADYIPALYVERESEFAETLGKNALERYRATGGSFEFDAISEMYRSPVELGWGKSIK
jgi:vanillate/3-O-methylgallate O-demethylase